MMRFMLLASIGAFVAIVGGCSKKEKATAAGATIGAVTGAGIGSLAGGGDGAVIGAVTGGIFGGLFGNATASDDAKAKS